ncbi:hypothetical protein JB92DRAFT_2873344 [Gautieria morchelliformis]|nr:hypothetical protein JB92DRAFT_2873344 [Gautieria morchelliformis]
MSSRAVLGLPLSIFSIVSASGSCYPYLLKLCERRSFKLHAIRYCIRHDVTGVILSNRRPFLSPRLIVGYLERFIGFVQHRSSFSTTDIPY